jgi:putative FmdB family regulatory protein
VPTYDFKCEACGDEFEALTEPGATPPCPRCGSGRTRRLWSPGFRTLKWGLRGKAAQESDSRRAEREAARQDRIAGARKRRKTGGPPGG